MLEGAGLSKPSSLDNGDVWRGARKGRRAHASHDHSEAVELGGDVLSEQVAERGEC